MFNGSFNKDRLKKARIYNGYNQKELAEKADCARQTISAYESGKEVNPDFNIINKISDVLDFPVGFFYQGDLKAISSSTFFRAQLTTSQLYKDQNDITMEFISQIYSFVSKYIDFPELELPVTRGNESPKEAADLLRSAWRLGSTPIDDMIFTIESKGVIVTKLHSNTSTIDACSRELEQDGKRLFIIGYTDNHQSAARIHFDMAHELGHLMLHDMYQDLSELSKEEFRAQEKQAHEFAGAFLLPKKGFYPDIVNKPFTIPYYTQLKRKWKTSISAMARRAHDLEVVTYEQYQKMIIDLQRRGFRKDEPLDDTLTTSPPTYLIGAIKLLLDEGVFTPKEFLDELSFSCNFTIHARWIEHILDLPEGMLQQEAKVHEFRLIRR